MNQYEIYAPAIRAAIKEREESDPGSEDTWSSHEISGGSDVDVTNVDVNIYYRDDTYEPHWLADVHPIMPDPNDPGMVTTDLGKILFSLPLGIDNGDLFLP